jgi:CheY-like chemotaxis protein
MAKIKIVDDDKEYAANLSFFLQQAGYEVTMTDHTDGLVDDLAREMPDLLLMDVMFPGNPVGGFDAVRAVRARKETRDIPIILLTAVNEDYPMNFSARDMDPEWLPIQDFEEKPVAKARLLKKIAKLLVATIKK